ncbi:MAG: glycosyltransferase family 4 protein [Lentisphaeria bacterium]
MYNGVDVQRFRPVADESLRRAQRAAWQVDDDAVVLLFVAHNLRLKNLALLCRVLATRTPETVRLVIVGRKRPAFSSPLLHYAGVSDTMELCYQAADVLVHPSFFDAGANVVLEAMSCGLPVIVSDRCGTDELVNDGGNGYVLPVVGKSSDEQWDHAIGQLVDDPALRGRLGIAARETAEQHAFSDYVVNFERLLGEVLKQKRTPD